MNIAIIGTGYVGLVAGTCFADSGNDVACVDIDPRKIEILNNGGVPIYEPGLADLIQRNREEGRLKFTTDLAAAVRASRIVFIAVGTPEGEDGSADLRHVLEAARQIGRALDGPKIVVTKSTVPVGTAAKVRAVLQAETPQRFAVVSNPEFLKEGAAVEDFLKPDRVVIGSDDPEALETMKSLYAPFVRTGRPILEMDLASAELTKYAANAMLAVRISFMNEIARLAEKVAADIDHVRRGLGSDGRIGPAFLFPGAGYGGSCFPKDVQALIRTGREHGVDLSLVQAADRVNDAQKELLFRKVSDHFGGALRGRTFAVWGLAFKPRTDDMREAPSIVLIDRLLEAGASVRASDPEAIPVARRIWGDRVAFHKLPYDAADGADALVVVTEWNEYRFLQYDRLRERLRRPLIFDGRNLYNPREMIQNRFTYVSFGR